MTDVRQPMPLLSVRNLTVEIRTAGGHHRAVDDVSYDLGAGEILGLVGESGSGKTLSALAILGLVPHPQGRVSSGHIVFEGNDLLAVAPKMMRKVRGRRIAMIFQDPTTALNPVFSIGRQVMDALLAHDHGLGRAAARLHAAELLDLVGISDPDRRLKEYPHQWSGGMRQRAMIAIAIANRPAVLIADEPTTSLDVTVQAQVMEALEAARRETGAAMILISHDLGLIAQMVDRVIVMYAGRVMESGLVADIFAQASNPYTTGLLNSVPRIGDSAPLSPIPGRPPTLQDRPSGCAFHPRCPLAAGRELCTKEVPRFEVTDSGSFCACHFSAEWVAGAASGNPSNGDGHATGFSS